MKTFEPKKFELNGREVVVEIFDPDPTTPQITLRATCGNTMMEREHLVGGTDAATMAANIDAADEQAKLDAECQRLAGLAERAERARLAKQSLQ